MSRTNSQEPEEPPHPRQKRIKGRRTLSSQAGFTLTEMLMTIVIIGILGAIASVAMQMFRNDSMLKAAQDEVFQTMRQAQAEAQRTRSDWEASFRETAGIVQVSVHPATALPTEIVWQDLQAGIRIDMAETTLPHSNNIYRAEFNYHGHVAPPFGRLTLFVENGGALRRCVFTSTLLGTLRKARNQRTPDASGRYCY